MRNDLNYICDDCHSSATFRSYKKARADGWAVSKDYKSCYCPECAPAHRLGGANGKRNNSPRRLPKGYVQINLEDII